jgi:RNA polymerase sigma-70 factor, ECF subfamily
MQNTALAAFEEVRPRLFGVAYRMMGSVTEADDVLQDAWLRWQGTDRAAVDNPEAFLTTTVTRLSINALTSARATRETYIGSWLPEPVSTAEDPALGADRAEALELAVVMLLERLEPAERAAYVLREAFDYPYREIGEVLSVTEANARQLAHRARGHIGRRRAAAVDPAERNRILTAFVGAATSGDLAALESVLTEDVVSISDGGGFVSAARVPVVGRNRVARFVAGTVARFGPGSHPVLVEVNGRPSVLTIRDSDPDTLLSFEVGPDGIKRLLFVRNPHKLERLRTLIRPDGESA